MLRIAIQYFSRPARILELNFCWPILWHYLFACLKAGILRFGLINIVSKKELLVARLMENSPSCVYCGYRSILVDYLPQYALYPFSCARETCWGIPETGVFCWPVVIQNLYRLGDKFPTASFRNVSTYYVWIKIIAGQMDITET